MPAPMAMKTKNQQWEVNCAPECGFMVRDHNQRSLVNAVQGHIKNVHPEKGNVMEKDVMAMAKKL